MVGVGLRWHTAAGRDGEYIDRLSGVARRISLRARLHADEENHLAEYDVRSDPRSNSADGGMGRGDGEDGCGLGAVCDSLRGNIRASLQLAWGYFGMIIALQDSRCSRSSNRTAKQQFGKHSAFRFVDWRVIAANGNGYDRAGLFAELLIDWLKCWGRSFLLADMELPTPGDCCRLCLYISRCCSGSSSDAALSHVDHPTSFRYSEMAEDGKFVAGTVVKSVWKTNGETGKVRGPIAGKSKHKTSRNGATKMAGQKHFASLCDIALGCFGWRSASIPARRVCGGEN